MPRSPSAVRLDVESRAVLPGRSLWLSVLEITADAMVLRYRVAPGIGSAELVRDHRALQWQVWVEDDVGGEYFEGLNSGGFETDTAVSNGDRSSVMVPRTGARFVSLSVFSPRTTTAPFGREVLTCHVPLKSGTTLEELAQHVEARRLGRRRMLEEIRASSGRPSNGLAWTANPSVHPWGRSLAAAGEIVRDGAGWRIAESGPAVPGAD